MRGFEYIASTTIEEATAVLAEHGDGARILAGGTDLLVQLREGLCAADVVLDIKKVPELTEVSFPDGGGLRLGAAVPFHRIWGDERVIDAYPALTDASRIVGGWQIQGRASVGGNLCNSSPAADTTPALIVEGAECHIAGPTGRRHVPAAEFCTGPGLNVLERGELLVSLEFPACSPRSGSRYVRFIPRNEMDIAVAGAGAWLELDEAGDAIVGARIALAAVSPRAVEATEAAAWLLGRPATPASFERAGELARAAADPISDMRGPREYRVHLVGVLVKRALSIAADRARGGDRSPILPTAG